MLAEQKKNYSDIVPGRAWLSWYKKKDDVSIISSQFARLGGEVMGHQIAEAIIKNGSLIRVNKKLPSGTIKVHLIYDTDDDMDSSIIDMKKLIRETSGIYPKIDAGKESVQLRNEWTRYE